MNISSSIKPSNSKDSVTEDAFEFVRKSPSYESLSGSDSEWIAARSRASSTDSGFSDSGLEKFKEETKKTKKVFSETPRIDGNNFISNFPSAEIVERREELRHFYDLKLSENDEGKIQGFIKDLAEKTYSQLLRNYAETNQRGEELKVVHPMRFIGHILSEPNSSLHLKTVRSDFFKYGGFVKGFSDHMKEKAEKENLLLYSPGFAEHVRINKAIVDHAIQSKQYKDLIEETLKSKA